MTQEPQHRPESSKAPGPAAVPEASQRAGAVGQDAEQRALAAFRAARDLGPYRAVPPWRRYRRDD
ncbi:hypothetical protein [Streptomyces sp. NPDC057557]|uniref:hypothetical protein n=1 Tax=Streptomyces sp. NPDC057557 TaxID=3346167 RepID=UPI0036A79DE5